MRLGHTRAPALLAVLATVTLGIAACGGGGGDSDEDQIKDVIDESVTGHEASICTDLITDDFVQQAYGAEADPQAACVESVENESAEDPDSVDVGSIDVKGDSATAEITLRGGSGDGQQDTVTLVKDGDDWKLDGAGGVAGPGAVEQVTRQAIEGTGDFTSTQVDCILDGVRSDLAPFTLDELQQGIPPALANKIQQVAQGCIS